MDCYGQCQWAGGAPARASAQLDVTFAFEGSREVEKVSLGSLSPQLSASHDLIVPGNGQDWTGRSPDSKGPGGTRTSPLLLVHPLLSSTPTSQGSGLCFSCSVGLFSLSFQMAWSCPPHVSSADTRNRHVQSGSAFIIKTLLRAMSGYIYNNVMTGICLGPRIVTKVQTKAVDKRH